VSGLQQTAHQPYPPLDPLPFSITDRRPLLHYAEMIEALNGGTSPDQHAVSGVSRISAPQRAIAVTWSIDKWSPSRKITVGCTLMGAAFFTEMGCVRMDFPPLAKQRTKEEEGLGRLILSPLPGYVVIGKTCETPARHTFPHFPLSVIVR
jgi:hypothetical protein